MHDSKKQLWTLTRGAAVGLFSPRKKIARLDHPGHFYCQHHIALFYLGWQEEEVIARFSPCEAQDTRIHAGWRSGSTLTAMDVRMCCDTKPQRILKSFSSSNIWHLFCLFKAEGRPRVVGLRRILALNDRYASQISTGLQIVTNVYINVNVLT